MTGKKTKEPKPKHAVRDLDGTFKKERKRPPTAGTYKKGVEKHPDAGKKKGTLNKKTEKFLNDMFDTYDNLGGQQFIQTQAGKTAKMAEKFLDRLTKISIKELERELQVSLHVSGQIELDHVHKFGFSPEMVVSAISQLQESNLNPENLLALPIPVGDEIIDVEGKEVNMPRGTLEEKDEKTGT